MNKKVLYVIIIILVLTNCVSLFFLLKNGNNTSNVIGVYHADDWTSSDKHVSLILNEDKTCEYIYPLQFNCKWESDENEVILSLDSYQLVNVNDIYMGDFSTLESCNNAKSINEEGVKCKFHAHTTTAIIVDNGLMLNNKILDKVR